MMEHSQIIRDFYTAFARHDAEGMAACYHPNIIFSDPAFGTLKGKQVSDMWKMLIERSKGNLKITFSNIQTDDHVGSANWTAEYLFSKTGRNVVNKVYAEFEFKDGLIISHTDHFDFWKWSQQALGIKGLLLGWLGFLRAKVRQQARHSLENYQKRH